jgi:hypothetical protein
MAIQRRETPSRPRRRNRNDLFGRAKGFRPSADHAKTNLSCVLGLDFGSSSERLNKGARKNRSEKMVVDKPTGCRLPAIVIRNDLKYRGQ